METITLVIALAVGLVILTVKPVNTLLIYIMLLVWYPSYVTAKFGTIDFPVCRILIIFIYIKIFISLHGFRQFKFILLDKLVIICFVAQIVAGVMNVALEELLINRFGGFFDTVLPYFAVRLLVKNKNDYLNLLKGIVYISVPLAIVGIYQSITGYNPFGFFRRYHAWKPQETWEPMWRGAFCRAEVTFPMSIMYGLFFSAFAPVCSFIVYSVNDNKKIVYVIFILIMALGAVASMSGGPILALLVSGIFFMFFKYRAMWKPALGISALICLTIEIASNRHFYDLIGSLTFNPATAWHRSKLISIALWDGGMQGHWFAGYGFADPGWGPQLGVGITDITNHYILVLCQYGLIGLIPFVLLVIETVKHIISALSNANSLYDNRLVWCLASSMCGILVAMATVSLFGQPLTCFFIILGISANLNVRIFRTGSGAALNCHTK